MHTLFSLVLFCTAALGLAAAEPPLVVTANTILDDLVHQVGGDQVRTHCLVQPGDDPHAFEPRPSDVKRLVAAAILVVNGLNLEPSVLKLAQNCGFRGEILVATAGLTPRRGAAHHEESEDHAPLGTPSSSSAPAVSAPTALPAASTSSTQSTVSTTAPASAPIENRKSEIENSAADPHAWQSPRNVATYIANIRDALTRANPAATALYASRAAAYLAELDALDLWVREQVATIPPARRKLVTSHDSLGYFADAYGFETVPLAGLSTSAEPDARTLATIVDLIRHEQVPAVFIELTANPKLVRQIGADASVRLAAPLFTDSLGAPGSGAETYLALIRTNTTRIVSALR
jgi:zinc/manganese transport system substrate-binding protein